MCLSLERFLPKRKQHEVAGLPSYTTTKTKNSPSALSDVSWGMSWELLNTGWGTRLLLAAPAASTLSLLLPTLLSLQVGGFAS